MEEKEWKKAINCTKEQLIEWLNEMYKDDKIQKDIIRKYEDNYNVGSQDIQEVIEDPLEQKQKLRYYTKVTARNFEYIRNWR
jgi:hypothetical protein